MTDCPHVEVKWLTDGYACCRACNLKAKRTKTSFLWHKRLSYGRVGYESLSRANEPELARTGKCSVVVIIL